MDNGHWTPKLGGTAAQLRRSEVAASRWQQLSSHCSRSHKDTLQIGCCRRSIMVGVHKFLSALYFMCDLETRFLSFSFLSITTYWNREIYWTHLKLKNKAMIMSRARDCSSDHQGCRDGDWRWKTRTYLLTCLHDPIMHFLQSSTGKCNNLHMIDVVFSLKRNN